MIWTVCWSWINYPYINVYYEKKSGRKKYCRGPLAPGLWGNPDFGMTLMRLIAQMEQMVFRPHGINPIQKNPYCKGKIVTRTHAWWALSAGMFLMHPSNSPVPPPPKHGCVFCPHRMPVCVIASPMCRQLCVWCVSPCHAVWKWSARLIVRCVLIISIQQRKSLAFLFRVPRWKWVSEHKFALLMMFYVLLLLFVGLYNSKSFHSFLRKYSRAFRPAYHWYPLFLDVIH